MNHSSEYSCSDKLVSFKEAAWQKTPTTNKYYDRFATERIWWDDEQMINMDSKTI